MRDRHSRRDEGRRLDDATVDDVWRVFEETDTVKEADESVNGQRGN